LYINILKEELTKSTHHELINQLTTYINLFIEKTPDKHINLNRFIHLNNQIKSLKEVLNDYFNKQKIEPITDGIYKVLNEKLERRLI